MNNERRDDDSPIEMIGSFGSIPPEPLSFEPTPPSGTTTTSATTSEVIRPRDLSLEEDDDDIDESLSERLWGLTEMFPEGLQTAVSSLAFFSVVASKKLFSLSKTMTWIAASSASILILPVMFEAERAQLQEQQIQQQRQILLGPNAAVSGAGAGSGLLPGAMPGAMPLPLQQR